MNNKRFNSKIASDNVTPTGYDPATDTNGENDGAIRVKYDQDTNYSQIGENPESGNGFTKRRAKNVAKYILKNYKSWGYSEPPTGDVKCHTCGTINTCSNDKHSKTSDRDLIGITKNRKGEWSYNERASRLANVRTLADYDIPVETRQWSGQSNQKRNLSLLEGVLTPSLHIGYDINGDQIHAGQYTNKNKSGKIMQYTADPMHFLSIAHALRSRIYNKYLTADKLDVKGLFKDLASVTHLFHGHKITEDSPATSEDAPGTKWHGLEAGQSPLYGGEHINICVNNMAHATTPKESVVLKSKSAFARLRSIHDDAKTADFVLDNCPFCHYDHGHTNVFNSIWDMQHHKKVANSTDPLIRRAYRSSGGFGKGKNSVVGDPSIVGPVGLLSHHIGSWPTDSTNRYLKHLFRSYKAEARARANGEKPPRIRDITSPLPYSLFAQENESPY